MTRVAILAAALLCAGCAGNFPGDKSQDQIVADMKALCGENPGDKLPAAQWYQCGMAVYAADTPGTQAAIAGLNGFNQGYHPASRAPIVNTSCTTTSTGMVNCVSF